MVRYSTRAESIYHLDLISFAVSCSGQCSSNEIQFWYVLSYLYTSAIRCFLENDLWRDRLVLFFINYLCCPKPNLRRHVNIRCVIHNVPSLYLCFQKYNLSSYFVTELNSVGPIYMFVFVLFYYCYLCVCVGGGDVSPR